MTAKGEPESEAFYVKEGGGNLPYLVFFQSKGGWPVFEMVATWDEAHRVKENFRVLGVRVQIYHWIQFDEDVDADGIEPAHSRKVTLPPLAPDSTINIKGIDKKK